MVTSPRYGQEKFIKKLEIIVSKKSKAKLNLDCGWYSEQELYDVLNWAETFLGYARPDNIGSFCLLCGLVFVH